jgi:hypothetical protein
VANLPAIKRHPVGKDHRRQEVSDISDLNQSDDTQRRGEEVWRLTEVMIDQAVPRVPEAKDVKII